MLSQEVLEDYFDHLLGSSGDHIDSNHPLVQDAPMEEKVSLLRKSASALLETIQKARQNVGAGAVSCEVAHSILSAFVAMSTEEINDAVRKQAVDKVLATAALPIPKFFASYPLLYAVLLYVFGAQAEQLANEIQALTVALHEAAGAKKNSFFGKKENKNAETESEIAVLLSQIEQTIDEIELGILARDKRMLEMLRLLKNAFKGQIVAMAVEKTMAMQRTTSSTIRDIVEKKQAQKIGEEMRKAQRESAQLHTQQVVETPSPDMGSRIR